MQVPSNLLKLYVLGLLGFHKSKQFSKGTFIMQQISIFQNFEIEIVISNDLSINNYIMYKCIY